MPQQLDRSKLDSAAVQAIADALPGARTSGAPFQAFVRAGKSNLCVSAVEAPAGAADGEFFEAAARRAATRDRRLLPVVDTGELDGCLWIAYDMGSNTPLAEYRKHLLLPTATWLRVLGDVARALDEAAERGVFAHEVGPQSVFVSRRGACLGDLGTAREAFGGHLPGSDLAYVPPEVLRGEPAVERSGVYVFGALLYHLLAGASPRRRDEAANGDGAGIVSLAGWRPDLPPAMDSVVAAAMADEPRRRLRAAGEAFDLARHAIRGELPTSWTAPPPPPSPNGTRASDGRRDPARPIPEPPVPGPPKFNWSDIAPPLPEPGPSEKRARLRDPIPPRGTAPAPQPEAPRPGRRGPQPPPAPKAAAAPLAAPKPPKSKPSASQIAPAPPSPPKAPPAPPRKPSPPAPKQASPAPPSPPTPPAAKPTPAEKPTPPTPKQTALAATPPTPPAAKPAPAEKPTPPAPKQTAPAPSGPPPAKLTPADKHAAPTSGQTPAPEPKPAATPSSLSEKTSVPAPKDAAPTPPTPRPAPADKPGAPAPKLSTPAPPTPPAAKPATPGKSAEPTSPISRQATPVPAPAATQTPAMPDKPAPPTAKPPTTEKQLAERPVPPAPKQDAPTAPRPAIQKPLAPARPLEKATAPDETKESAAKPVRAERPDEASPKPTAPKGSRTPPEPKPAAPSRPSQPTRVRPVRDAAAAPPSEARPVDAPPATKPAAPPAKPDAPATKPDTPPADAAPKPSRTRFRGRLRSRPAPDERPKQPAPDLTAGRRRRASEPVTAAAPARQRDHADPVAPDTRVRRRRHAVAIGGALVIGSVAGVLLGGSPEPAPAKAEVVNAAGMTVTLPPDWEVVRGSGTLAVRLKGDPGSRLEARLVDEPLERAAGAQPVQLGDLQAWRTTTPDSLRYAAPTTGGTLLVTCQAPPAGPRLLRLCERTASTLELRNASPLPLAGVIEEEGRLRATIKSLRANREAGRGRLARAERPSGQREVAQALARSHERAARALAQIDGAEPVAAAVRKTAAAYTALAKAAGTKKSVRWNRARNRMRRNDAMLAEVLDAAGG